MSAPGSSDRDYVERLGAALRTRDPQALREFLISQAQRYGDKGQVDQIAQQSAEVLEALLHRMALARSDLSEYHAESRAWLARHGAVPPPIKCSTPADSPGRCAPS